MAIFRREPTPAAPTGPPVEDTPADMLATVSKLATFVNLSAGKLPVESVVAALNTIDTLREVIGTADERPLDIHAIVSIRGIIDDYLPTTLHAYLGLDPSQTEVTRPSGRTPKASLLDQLESLWLAANDILSATRGRDADALLTQGSFLATKFARSDLDL
jgi:hypothetical protein